MKKSAIALVFSLFLAGAALAQNVQEGVNHLYAERNASAKAIFEKLISANPNNLEAVYWMGQLHLSENNLAAAKDLYTKALAANNNAPLILVGAGHVDLLEGRAAEGRQRFETAITASKGRKGNDPAVLNAVGRANVNAYSDAKKLGDLDYAIAKLNEAAAAQPTNADIFLNLGNAHRKKHNGGEAVIAYRKASDINPAFAPAFYRTASIYRSQRNWDAVTNYLTKAVEADPKFAPAYEGLYDYYLRYKQDFGQASEYANKYVAAADPSIENEYMKAQTDFVQKKYDAAIATGQKIIAGTNNNPRPRVYRLMAYSLLEKGDTAGAKPYVDQFFTRASGDDIIGNDYILRGIVYSKDDPNAMLAAYRSAVAEDSVLANQVRTLNEAIELFRKQGNKVFEADVRLLSYQLRGDQVNKAELFVIGLPYYQGGAYQRADSLFKAYATAFPDSIHGYFWSARALSLIDTSMSQGLAVPQYEKVLEIAARDKERFKTQAVSASGYLAGYYNNIKSDRATALKYAQRGLEFDPQNATLQNIVKALGSGGGGAKPAAKPPTKPSSGTPKAKPAAKGTK